MSVIVKENVITLNTKNTSYQMYITPYNHVLHTYYGRRIMDGEDMSYTVAYIDRGNSGNPHDVDTDRTYSLDTLPQELSFQGGGDLRVTAFGMEDHQGIYSSDLRFLDFRVESGKYSIPGLPSSYCDKTDITYSQCETFVLTLEDKRTGVEIDLLYGVFEETDIITRAAVVRNTGKGTYSGQMSLHNIMSANLDIQGGEHDLIMFHGKHGMERIPERLSIGRSCHMVSSRRGHSSHHESPFVIVCDRDANEDYGSAYGMNFVYSGNFASFIQKDAFGITRMTMGINPEMFSWELPVGESFYTPEVAMSYSDKGLGKLSQNYHRFVRHNICRGKYKLTRRPVLINNWEATYFDFDGEKLADIAKTAANLGVEMFVLDDGWFGNRDFDDKALGDWEVNEEKLGCTMGELSKKINDAGMKFGLWFEPEMVNENSDLYRNHPDWALAVPGNDPVRGRMQLVLDFSRKEVVDYIYEKMAAILDNANIEYIKWDFNRSIVDVYSSLDGKQNRGAILHRFVMGTYDLARRLNDRYPDMYIEGCCGGGGRFDLGMMCYTPQIWCSDNTDAIERLQIQYGTSFGFPVSVVGSHVSAVPNHQTGRITPLSTRGIVAMSGSFGYELDLGTLSDEEKSEVSSQIESFKKYWNVIHNGLYYRLSDPVNNMEYCAWENVSEDETEILVSMVKSHKHFSEGRIYVKLKGLNEKARYEIVDINYKPIYENPGHKSESLAGKVFSGAALMNAGLYLDYNMLEYEAMQIYLKRI